MLADLDSQFAAVRGDLGARIDALDARLISEMSGLRDKIDGVDSRLGTEVGRLDAKIDSVEARLETKIESSAAQTRRHFDVVMEQMQSRMGLVIEGTPMVDEKGERRYVQIRADLATLDERVTRLEAKGAPRRKPRRR